MIEISFEYVLKESNWFSGPGNVLAQNKQQAIILINDDLIDSSHKSHIASNTPQCIIL